ncbi:lipopolysaccharide assembly protein LapA domain-containing protein [Hyphobacterium sp.]|uniref:lipopolysaccharide assembly protein LapA domain-containing protein n=1 Tax=Hyphobacterium sp. TaxID=2004662 RepID=UPI003BA8D4C5
MMKTIRFWLAVALGAFLALFAFQNMATVEVDVLFWTFESRRIVVIGLTLITGIAIGWIMNSLTR